MDLFSSIRATHLCGVIIIPMNIQPAMVLKQSLKSLSFSRKPFEQLNVPHFYANTN